MRNRYVKKCGCSSFVVVTKSTVISQKGVLDIELVVSCKRCKRPLKEIYSKRTRMVNPKVVNTIEKAPEMPVKEELFDKEFNAVEPQKEPVIIEYNETEEIANEQAVNRSNGVPERESEEVTVEKEKPNDHAPEAETKSEFPDEERDRDEGGTPDKVQTQEEGRLDRTPGKAVGTADVSNRSIEESAKDSGIPLSDIF